MASSLLHVAACLFAGAFGFLGHKIYIGWSEQKRRHDNMLLNASLLTSTNQQNGLECQGIAAALIMAAKNYRVRSSKKDHSGLPLFLLRRAEASYDSLSQSSGLSDAISKKVYVAIRLRLCAGGVLLGLLVGSVFSAELSALLAFLGLIAGWMSMPWAYKQEIRARNNGLEKQLSEMIEVVSLGLRSGLTFDRSLEMYHQHFQTTLSSATALAQRRWTVGLATREEALRSLARSYDSALFTRIVGNIVRSLRFGAALADSLEASAAESRSIHKAKVEERVAKAPVKMLLPTGTLILPAMLLLVLGPVLLDLMQGF